MASSTIIIIFYLAGFLAVAFGAPLLASPNSNIPNIINDNTVISPPLPDFSPLRRNFVMNEYSPLEEMFEKRDLEEPIFIDPSEDSELGAMLYNLPRTDRKTLIADYFDSILPLNSNPFDAIPIDPRSIPLPSRQNSPPSQKEFIGPIVVGPQTKSTQTNSAKKN